MTRWRGQTICSSRRKWSKARKNKRLIQFGIHMKEPTQSWEETQHNFPEPEFQSFRAVGSKTARVCLPCVKSLCPQIHPGSSNPSPQPKVCSNYFSFVLINSACSASTLLFLPENTHAPTTDVTKSRRETSDRDEQQRHGIAPNHGGAAGHSGRAKEDRTTAGPAGRIGGRGTARAYTRR